MNSNSVAMKRIQKEQRDMIQNPSPYFYAEPLEVLLSLNLSFLEWAIWVAFHN